MSSEGWCLAVFLGRRLQTLALSWPQTNVCMQAKVSFTHKNQRPSSWPQKSHEITVPSISNYSHKDGDRLIINWKQSVGDGESAAGRTREGESERQRVRVCVRESEWEVGLAARCQRAWELRGTSGPSLAPEGSAWWLTRTRGCTYVHGYTFTPQAECAAICSFWRPSLWKQWNLSIRTDAYITCSYFRVFIRLQNSRSRCARVCFSVVSYSFA